MTRSRNTVLALGALGALQAASAQSLTPLASKSFAYDALPTAAAGDNAGPRGPQYGFNNCNLSTAGKDSNCQTLVINSLSDFCIWGIPTADETIADTEAREVAYCVNPERGGRPIPPGAIQGAQWLYADNYIQLAMYIDQTAFGLSATDPGGELDPHGADEQGNPLGGLLYSNSFTHSDKAAQFNQRLTSGTTNTTDNEEELIEWVEFIGDGIVCIKACTNSDPNRALLCNHIYDEIGCAYNAIADYSKINGSFTVCDSTDMDPPGIFTEDGALTTWRQPFSGTFQVPYTPTQVASSNCFTYQSTQLYPGLVATPTGSSKPGAATATGSGGINGSSRSGSAGGPAATAGSGSNAAAGMVVGPVSILAGAMLGVFVTLFV